MLSMALKFCSSPMMGNLAASSCRMPRVPQRALVVMATAKDPTISQSNFVKKFAQKHGLDEKSARAAVKGVLDMITDEVAEGNKVTFLGFGAFSPKHRPARKARNPKTQEELDVPASTVPHFSASKTFKEKVGQAHNGAA